MKKKKSIVLGVIPARGGSKGIKNKNIQLIGDKPLISFTIKTALSCKGVDIAIVTTDSKRIARVAEKYGAHVPFLRPKKLAHDRTSMLKVLRHTLVAYERLNRVTVTGVVLFDPTSPVRKKDDIERMIALFKRRKPDLIVSVTPARRSPYFNMLKKGAHGYGQLVMNGAYIRRQDVPAVFDITNNCWIFSRTAVMHEWRIPAKTIMYEQKSDYIDIDTADDLERFREHVRARGKK